MIKLSIPVPNTVAELTVKARELGILDEIKGTRKDGSHRKDDLVVPIRNYLLDKKYNNRVPHYLKTIQGIKSPMLSKRIDELKQDIQDEIWNGDSWYFEEKVDGIRCIILKDDSGVHFFSREHSRETLMPIEMEINSNLWYYICKAGIKESFILDCEITSENPNTCEFLRCHGINSDSNTQAINILLNLISPVLSRKIQENYNFKYMFNIFDCLYTDSWITSARYSDRVNLTKYIVQLLLNEGAPVRLVNSTNQDKRGFFNRCLASGFEGCIAKQADSEYIPDSTRSAKGWIKVKRPKVIKRDIIDLDSLMRGGGDSTYKTDSIESTSVSAVGDTVDAFITGFEVGRAGTLSENLIDSIDVSVLVMDSGTLVSKSLGRVHHIEAMLRDYLTEDVGGSPTLNPQCYRAVVELDALCNMALRIRPDKSSGECVMELGTYNQIMSMK